MVKRVSALVFGLLLASCNPKMLGHVVKERPTILDDPHVLAIDPEADGSQVTAFLDAHNSGGISGLCQGMLSVELTPSELCIITESGAAYLIVDYTRDPLGVDGYRIQPLQYQGGSRFRDTESRQLFLLEPWLPSKR